MTTSAIYLHHERSTQATAEADAQNREIVLDKANLCPLGRFNDGTLFHVVTQEQPAVALAGSLAVALAAALNSTLSVASLSTLTGGGVIAAPTDSASKLQIGGSVSGKNTTLTGNTTLDVTHHTLECNATAGSFVVTLPAAAGCVGRRYALHKNDTSANTVTVQGNAAETIDGSNTVVLGGNLGISHLVIESNGTTWRIEWIYEEGTFTASASGFTAGVTGTARYVRVGKMVTLYLPGLGGTSNSVAFSITGSPASIWPARLQLIPLSKGNFMDNSVTLSTLSASLRLNTDGSIQVTWTQDGNTSTGTSWTAAGTKSLSLVTVNYTLQ